MPDALALTWRQYRLERRMFWRNPSAAFFNFVLPLLFLCGGGAILQRQPARPEPAGAGDRGHERDVDDVHRAGLQHRVPARARRAQAHPRDAAADGLLLRRRGRQRGHQHGAADRDHRARRARLLRDRLAAALGRADRVRARRRRLLRGARASPSRTSIPNFESTAAYVNAVFLPVVFISFFVFDTKSAPALPAQHRRRAAAEAADRRAVRGDGDRHEPRATISTRSP